MRYAIRSRISTRGCFDLRHQRFFAHHFRDLILQKQVQLSIRTKQLKIEGAFVLYQTRGSSDRCAIRSAAHGKRVRLRPVLRGRREVPLGQVPCCRARGAPARLRWRSESRPTLERSGPSTPPRPRTMWQVAQFPFPVKKRSPAAASPGAITAATEPAVGDFNETT